MKSSMIAILFISALVSFLHMGCQTMDTVSDLGASIAVASGAIDTNQAASIRRAGSAIGKTFDDITPEQEYYIGRAVAATLLEDYKPLNDPKANLYVNLVGQSLSRFSKVPETFGGYHFYILASRDINAFACPGGLVLVTQGLLECCKTEDQLAAVLAHEIGHVENKDGLRAISRSRLTNALTILATESARNFGGEDLAELTNALEGSVQDVIHQMVVNGYSRGQEREADRSAVRILETIGYDPNALVVMLSEMEKRLQPGHADFAKTHPSPESRIRDVKILIGTYRARPAPQARQARFNQAMAGI